MWDKFSTVGNHRVVLILTGAQKSMSSYRCAQHRLDSILYPCRLCVVRQILNSEEVYYFNFLELAFILSVKKFKSCIGRKPKCMQKSLWLSAWAFHGLLNFYIGNVDGLEIFHDPTHIESGYDFRWAAQSITRCCWLFIAHYKLVQKSNIRMGQGWCSYTELRKLHSLKWKKVDWKRKSSFFFYTCISYLSWEKIV